MTGDRRRQSTVGQPTIAAALACLGHCGSVLEGMWGLAGYGAVKEGGRRWDPAFWLGIGKGKGSWVWSSGRRGINWEEEDEDEDDEMVLRSISACEINCNGHFPLFFKMCRAEEIAVTPPRAKELKCFPLLTSPHLTVVWVRLHLVCASLGLVCVLFSGSSKALVSFPGLERSFDFRCPSFFPFDC